MAEPSNEKIGVKWLAQESCIEWHAQKELFNYQEIQCKRRRFQTKI